MFYSVPDYADSQFTPLDEGLTILILLFSIYLFISYFTVLYWFCHTSTCIHHGCTSWGKWRLWELNNLSRRQNLKGLEIQCQLWIWLALHPIILSTDVTGSCKWRWDEELREGWEEIWHWRMSKGGRVWKRGASWRRGRLSERREWWKLQRGPNFKENGAENFSQVSLEEVVKRL